MPRSDRGDSVVAEAQARLDRRLKIKAVVSGIGCRRVLYD
jgi:hypothetical protein